MLWFSSSAPHAVGAVGVVSALVLLLLRCGAVRAFADEFQGTVFILAVGAVFTFVGCWSGGCVWCVGIFHVWCVGTVRVWCVGTVGDRADCVRDDSVEANDVGAIVVGMST